MAPNLGRSPDDHIQRSIIIYRVIIFNLLYTCTFFYILYL